jgi:DNA-binding MarR family transcriptional regulator
MVVLNQQAEEGSVSPSRPRALPTKATAESIAIDDPRFRSYVREIAHARYLVRKIFRIVDDQAKVAGLEPLQHQMLIQIGGFADDPLPVNVLAERVDVVPAFASRIITSLEREGFVRRVNSPADGRVILVEPTDKGLSTLQAIDQRVQTHVRAFQTQVEESDRVAASEIFKFYLGLEE